MSRLSSIDPDTCFIDMEQFIHDAADMADTVNSIVFDLLGKKLEGDIYRIHGDSGNRLMFLAGIAVSMAEKVREAYAVAHANDVSDKKGREA